MLLIFSAVSCHRVSLLLLTCLFFKLLSLFRSHHGVLCFLLSFLCFSFSPFHPVTMSLHCILAFSFDISFLHTSCLCLTFVPLWSSLWCTLFSPIFPMFLISSAPSCASPVRPASSFDRSILHFFLSFLCILFSSSALFTAPSRSPSPSASAFPNDPRIHSTEFECVPGRAEPRRGGGRNNEQTFVTRVSREVLVFHRNSYLTPPLSLAPRPAISLPPSLPSPRPFSFIPPFENCGAF